MQRVLDIKKGKLSYVVGTVYLDMPLKPSILEDIVKDVSSPDASAHLNNTHTTLI